MSENAKHTPGPWVVETPMPDEYAIVQAGLETYEWQFIATVSVGIPAEGLMPRQEAKANARLIAAAPDLLAALRDLVAFTERQTATWPDQPQSLTAARAALTKTEG